MVLGEELSAWVILGVTVGVGGRSQAGSVSHKEFTE